MRGVVFALVRQGELVRDDHRDEAGVLLELLAHEVVDLAAVRRRSADLVVLLHVVPHRDRREIERSDLARRADAGFENVL